jgi:4-hydroxy-4-methyl-2-oxoglutarate aldolase
MSSAETVATQFDAATLHESAGRVGALPARLKPAYPGARIVGRALPVLSPVGDNLWIQRAIYEAVPGEVLVVATTASDEYGYWGEILSEAAAARGLAGLVIDGGVRDTAELVKVGFPVFSSAVCIRGTLKDPDSPGAVGAPVTIGRVTVHRGDLVLADQDGVMVVPSDRVDEVLDSARARVAKETDIIAQLREGKTSLELYHL